MNLAAVWNLRGLWPGYAGQAQRRLLGLRPATRRSQAGSGVAEVSLRNNNAAANDAVAGRSRARVATAAKPLTQLNQGASTQQGVLTEICTLQPSAGQTGQGTDGGLRQMLPALAGMCQSRWLLLVAPPEIPSVQQFIAAGIDPSRVLVLHPHAVRGVSVIEQALRSGTCGAVLLWLQQRDEQTQRRLRQAAEAGRCWGVLFRPSVRTGDEAPAQIELGLSG